MAMNSTAPMPDFRLSPDYKGHIVLALNSSLIACTTLIVGLRLYVRGFMSKALGIDDLLAGIAYVIIVTQSALDIRSVGYGSGAHIRYVPPELIPKFFAALVHNEFLYIIGTGLMRLSIVAFLPRLAKDLNSPIFLKSVYAVGVVVILQTLICFFYRLTSCTPISDIFLVPNPGMHCVSAQQEQNNFIAHQAIALIVDFALAVLPIWVIHTKMIFSKRKVQVILVFSVGAFVVATGIVRMVYLNTLLFLADPTFEMSTIGFWTDLEGHIGLWVGCFPALQPLLRQITFKLGIRSKLRSYGNSTEGAKKSGTGKGHMGGSGKWGSPGGRKSGYAMNGSGVDAETDDGSERGIVTTAKGDIEMYSLETDSSSNHIHKQVDFDIRVEERTEKDMGHANRGSVANAKRTPNKSWVDV